MQSFRKQSQIEAPSQVVFAWHESPDAFEKLLPPWENVRVVERSGPGIKIGAQITLEMAVGPFTQRWVAVHTRYEAGRMFCDEQKSGPFSAWIHNHIVESLDTHRSLLIDEIRYKLPLGRLGQFVGGWLVRRKLEKLFDYRHRVTKEACEKSLSKAAPDTQSPFRRSPKKF